MHNKEKIRIVLNSSSKCFGHILNGGLHWIADTTYALVGVIAVADVGKML